MKKIGVLLCGVIVWGLVMTAVEAQDDTRRELTVRQAAPARTVVHADSRTPRDGMKIAAASDCRRECRDQVDQWHQLCDEAGFPPEQCEAQAGAMLWDCLAAECGLEPPAAWCEFECHQRAGNAFGGCIEDGNTPAQCGPQGENAFRDCLINECGIEPDPEKCGQACLADAIAAFEACMEESGDEEACLATARTAFEDCVAAECNHLNPQGPACERGCRDDAGVVYDDCIASGEPVEVCGDLAQQFLRNCLIEVCGHEIPAGDQCVHDCHDAAADVFDECRANDGTKEECTDEAVVFIEGCLAECP